MEELNNIDWNDVINEESNVNNSYDLFYDKIESLLNTMTPIKIKKCEKRLEQRPWITKGISISMKKRDSLYKKLTVKNDNPLENRSISFEYKKYRNLIVTLLKRSKENYFQNYFEENKNDVKKNLEWHSQHFSNLKKKDNNY